MELFFFIANFFYQSKESVSDSRAHIQLCFRLEAGNSDLFSCKIRKIIKEYPKFLFYFPQKHPILPNLIFIAINQP